jgi:hypothetical protein
MLLTFEELPSLSDIKQRAHNIVQLLAGHDGAVMIGGAPYLMSTLENSLRQAGFTPLYAFSRRESAEATDPNTGAVIKTAVFRHIGFVSP